MKSSYTIDSLKSEANELVAKGQLSDQEFLHLAAKAAQLVHNDWELREDAAYHIAGVWLNQNHLSAPVYELGGRFADLELPDAHIVTTDGRTIREEWKDVEKHIVLLMKK